MVSIFMGEALKLLQYYGGSSPSPINCMGEILATLLFHLIAFATLFVYYYHYLAMQLRSNTSM